MNTILIQVRRNGAWCKVQSIPYDPDRDRNKRRGDITDYCRAGAIKAAQLAVTDWQASDQFIGCDFRLAEDAGYGKGLKAVRP